MTGNQSPKIGDIIPSKAYFEGLQILRVLVQDALELAPLYPSHPGHKFRMGLPQFPPLLADYQAKKAAKVRGQTGRGRRGVGRRGEGRWHACWPVRLQEPHHIAPLPPV